MRNLYPTIVQIDSHVPATSLLDRVNPRWLTLTVLPAFLLHGIGRFHAGPIAEQHHGIFAAWSLILLLVVPAGSLIALWLAHGVHQAFSAWRGRRRHSHASAMMDGIGLIEIAHAKDGTVRVRGELDRAPHHDPFDTRPPAFFLRDATGAATIDVDCLLLLDLRGALPPNGTLIEVAGPGRASADGFVFAGSPGMPIAIRPAASPSPDAHLIA